MSKGRKNTMDSSDDVLTEGLTTESSQHTFIPRRLIEDDEIDYLAHEVLELLERMRVDLNQFKESIDLREKTERAMSIRASQHLMASKRISNKKSKNKEDKVSEHFSCCGFFFIPMATAPLPRLTICDSEEKNLKTQNQHHQLTNRSSSVKSISEIPPWNGSTSLQGEEKLSTTLTKIKKSSIASNLTQERSLLSVKLPISTSSSSSPPLPLQLSFEEKLDTFDSTCSHSVLPNLLLVDPMDTISKNLGDEIRTNENYIRDYLRRLNIVRRELTEYEGRIDDPVLNGVALNKLIILSLNIDSNNINSNNIRLVQKPKNIDDVRQNYVFALSILMNVEKNNLFHIPQECRLIRPESVIIRGDTKSFFLLMRIIINTFLPIEYEQLWSAPSLTWQLNIDVFSYKPSAMRSLELAVCDFLYTQDILPDPIVHQLPPDNDIVPDALNAPFLPPQRKQWCMRREKFPALYIPSVYPFLTNGTALCDLVEKVTGTHFSVYRNPRVKSNCIENIQNAFIELKKFCPTKMNSLFLEDPQCVFYGDRNYILFLLEDIMRLENSAPPRRHSPKLTDIPYTDLRPFLKVSNSYSHSVEKLIPLELSEEKLCNISEILVNNSKRKQSNFSKIQTPERGTLRCVINSPFSVGETVEEKSFIPEKNSTSLIAKNDDVKRLTNTLDLPFKILNDINFTESEVKSLQKWLITALGTEFHYTAADNSFTISSHNIQIQEKSFIFSDGVVLAHLIRILERRPCSELESIEIHAKVSAAKRRNIRKCISFLQVERRILLNIPLLDEILLSGDRRGVLYVLMCLKNTYRFAVRI